jgi:hypothetical protein
LRQLEVLKAALNATASMLTTEALLREARRSFPFIERIIGDAGY